MRRGVDEFAVHQAEDRLGEGVDLGRRELDVAHQLAAFDLDIAGAADRRIRTVMRPERHRVSDEVADVTGAGDTVIAAFSAALAAGATTEEAAQLANYAGGIVVMKRGTATVSREELLRAIDQTPPSTRPH